MNAPPYWVTRRMAPPRQRRYRNVVRPLVRQDGKQERKFDMVILPDGALYVRPHRYREARDGSKARMLTPWRKVREGGFARRRQR